MSVGGGSDRVGVTEGASRASAGVLQGPVEMTDSLFTAHDRPARHLGAPVDPQGDVLSFRVPQAGAGQAGCGFSCFLQMGARCLGQGRGQVHQHGEIFDLGGQAGDIRPRGRRVVVLVAGQTVPCTVQVAPG